MLQILTEGEILDLASNQDISVSVINPFFESDRVPIAVSTPIEFRVTETNCRKFQFVPGPMMKPLRRKLPAVFVVDGITLWTGELQRDELSERTGIHYTFIGAEFEDITSGRLTDITFTPYQDIDFPAVVQNARNGLYPEFGLPMIIRKEFSAKTEYHTSTNSGGFPECSWTDKYANWTHTTTPFIIPAVKVRYILERILPGLEAESLEINRLLDVLAILGLYKNKKQDNRYGIEITYSDNTPSRLIRSIDLADSLPDMSAKDFVLNILKMTCSTLYCSGSNFVIRPNKSIIASPHFINWTNKVADIYSITDEEGQGYTLNFQNTTDNYAKKYSDEPGQPAEADNLPECSNMMEVLSKMQLAEDYISVKHTITGDVYSGKKINAILYYNWRTYTWYDFPTVVPILDIAHQAGFAQKDIEVSANAQKYDCSIDFEVPRCIPISVYETMPTDGTNFYEVVGKCAVAPVVEFPTLGDTRPTTVYIGLLLGNNFVDKGIYFTKPMADFDPGNEIISDLSLAIDGTNGLYETLHKPFAEWLKKAKDPRKVDLILTPHDIASLKIWMKYMFYNQLFFIKSLDFGFNTSSDNISTSAEIAEA